MGLANNFSIGADPEFAILNENGTQVIFTACQGKLGFDHGGRIVELRPDPSLSAQDILADIEHTLNRRELVPYRRYKWKAGGMGGTDPLGGHIHFDMPVPSNTLDIRLQAADQMTRWLEHIEILPKNESEMRRSNRYNYGRFGDFRGSGRRPDGTPRFEYRTPASWLYSPNSALAVLTCMKLALVNPWHTLDCLVAMDILPVTKLRSFIRGFRQTDDDAAELNRRVVEDNYRIRNFRGDPTVDLKTTWNLRPEEAATTESPSGGTPSRP